MVGTIIIELCLAVYTVVRYKMTEITRLITLTLFMLATFQLCEFFVCTGSAGHVPIWSRFGFAAITALPPLGLHILHVLSHKPRRRLVATAYATMVAFIAFFLLFPSVFNAYQCAGNYVIFHLRAHAGGVYWVYYFGWIFTSVTFGIRWLYELQAKAKTKPAERQLEAIQALIIGWFVFIIPTAVVNILKPSTTQGIPSIMCGFAVLFALILALYILPRAGKLKHAAPAKSD
jgi:hypothetical protein